MLSETPKQFHEIAGKPILMHTLSCFFSFDPQINIILVLPKPFFDFWNSLIKRYDFTIKHKVVEGGETRFHSVKNGLQHIKSGSLVAVHDGVRPLVSSDTICRVFETAAKKGNAIPVTSINESMRKVKGEQSNQVNRDEYSLVQTPQCFRSELLIKAYKQIYKEDFTDDATVIEAYGESIHLVEGNIENIKITRPFDLKIADAFLS